MLPLLRQIENAALGCWMLFLGQTEGKMYFDLTMRGFWLSFRLAVVIAILDALDGLSRTTPIQSGDAPSDPASASTILIVWAVASLLGFGVFPLLLAGLTRFMGLGKNYAAYITTRNWLTLFLNIPAYIIDLFSYFDLCPQEVRDPLVISLELLTLFAGAQLARLVLVTTWSLAFGFALLDFLLALLIGELAYRLIS